MNSVMCVCACIFHVGLQLCGAARHLSPRSRLSGSGSGAGVPAPCCSLSSKWSVSVLHPWWLTFLPTSTARISANLADHQFWG